MADSTPSLRVSAAPPVSFRPPRPWFLLCLVMIVVIVAYLPILGAPFVWDDHHLIEDSPLIKELHPLRDYFGEAFWQTDELGLGHAYYRPLAILSLAVDHSLYGDGAGGYHLSNLLVHVLCAVLLFRLLCIRGASGQAAAMGVALWSLHPRLTEAVAWISGRTDVLASFFVLAALLAQARAGAARRGVAALCLFLALLCKEVALAGVAAVIVLELTSPGSPRARAQRALPALLALSAYLILRVHASGISAARWLPPGTVLLRATAALGHYFAMFLTPWLPNLQIGQSSRPGVGYAVLGSLVLLGLVALSVRFGRRLSPAMWSALSLSALSLGMVLHVVPFSINVVAADRFLYLPLLGVTLLLTPALAALAKGKVVALACGLLSLSFVGATFVRADAWADEVTLWTRTYRDNPDNEYLACAQLGRLYVQAGLLAQAFSLYRGCAVTPARRFVLDSNAASALARSGRYREALASLDSLGEQARSTPVVALNRALFCVFLNDFAGARTAIAAAVSADPKSQNGLLLSRQLPALERARQQFAALPDSAPAIDRARSLQQLGLVAEALQAWQVAFASGSLSGAQFQEGLTFAIVQADARSLEMLHEQYLEQFARPENASLELAYFARQELSQRLLAVWPSLGLPLLPLPGKSSLELPRDGQP